MTTEDPAAKALRVALAAVGIDPSGLDLASLADIKAETELKIASFRALPGFGDAVPAFEPPRYTLPGAGGEDGAP